jgi:hypothetical protein
MSVQIVTNVFKIDGQRKIKCELQATDSVDHGISVTLNVGVDTVTRATHTQAAARVANMLQIEGLWVGQLSASRCHEYVFELVDTAGDLTFTTSG